MLVTVKFTKASELYSYQEFIHHGLEWCFALLVVKHTSTTEIRYKTGSSHLVSVLMLENNIEVLTKVPPKTTMLKYIGFTI